MGMASTPARWMASSLILLLVSCSVTRPSVSGPIGARDLGQYLLIIERSPDGDVAHSWKPVKDFNLTAHSFLATTHGVQGRIVQASFNRNCEESVMRVRACAWQD